MKEPPDPGRKGALRAGFGARLEPGGVRFRLWAPAARQVEVVLEDGGEAFALAPARDGRGWFEGGVPGVSAGARYRYRIDAADLVPDPASRYQPEGPLGPSEVVDPSGFAWQVPAWRGRRWEETVLYELHVGAFSPEGTFEGVRRRLDHLVALGITAIELMPVASFSGERGWGYDGVLPYAPHHAYGRPEDLARLVDAAHGRGLMVFLDVVYNHFGPEGNFLGRYAPSFFTERHHTPWGAAIDYRVPEVREFAIANALHWLHDYRLDGLRLDAVHAIHDDSEQHLLAELAERVHAGVGADRHVHLVLENGSNEAHHLERDPDGAPRHYVAQWNDDVHHCLHRLLTGEGDGYYEDFDRPAERLARGLAEGFVYQGEPSAHDGGAPRGEPSAHLPPTAFVDCLQNHDQVGNRALGERIDRLASTSAVAAARAVLLLSPHVPMLFMGEEWGEARPFLYFCDFHDALADAVRDGRRREFESFPAFRDPRARERIPDPNDPATFARSRLDWTRGDGEGAAHLARCQALLALRHREIVPRLAGTVAGRIVAPVPGDGGGEGQDVGAGGVAVDWRLADGAVLALRANLSPQAADELPPPPDGARRLFYEGEGARQGAGAPDPGPSRLPPWTVVWWLAEAPG